MQKIFYLLFLICFIACSREEEPAFNREDIAEEAVTLSTNLGLETSKIVSAEIGVDLPTCVTSDPTVDAYTWLQGGNTIKVTLSWNFYCVGAHGFEEIKMRYEFYFQVNWAADSVDRAVTFLPDMLEYEVLD